MSGGIQMTILEDVNKNKEKIVDLRRTLHRHPEIAHKEFNTHKILMEHLEELPVSIKDNVAGTGIVADLRGNSPGKTVAIRADIDGLPIKEETGLPFASENDGFMHACGHDAHMSMAYGAALTLANMKNKFDGTVRFLFQPAEEEGTIGGAKPMIDEGALEGVDFVIGQHVWPGLPQGTVGYRTGPFFAGTDSFQLRVEGKGGHAAMPNNTIDPIVISAHIIEALQSISSREIDPLEPIVVTVGSINGGTTNNVIPDFVDLSGTVRTLNPDTRNRIEEVMKRIIGGVTSSAKGSFSLIYKYGYPILINDKEVTKRVIKSARGIVGDDHIVEATQTMGAEDFAYYLQKVPGTFLLLGIYNEKLGNIYGVHTSKFRYDESVLPYGSAVMAQSALDLLKNTHA